MVKLFGAMSVCDVAGRLVRVPLSLQDGARDLARHDTLLISFMFGAKRIENLQFPAAVGLVRRYLDAEQTELVTLITQVNEDHWFTSFYSDLLGGASPPKEEDWSAPRIALGRALYLYDASIDGMAIRELQAGVRGFNDIHKTFYEYRSALAKGGSRAIVTLEITGMVAGAVFSGGVGVLPGVSLLTGSLASAGLTLLEQVAYNSAKVGYGVGKFDVADIVLQTSASFLSSIISGKLSEYFATKFVKQLVDRQLAFKLYGHIPNMSFRELVAWAAKNGVYLPSFHQTAKEFMVGFVASFGADRLLGVVTGVANACKGEWVTMEEFLRRLSSKLGDEVANSVYLRSDLRDAR